jgi:predicted 2-oxoglutarate/Fe(II)-dependent dioxygenase YbiX
LNKLIKDFPDSNYKERAGIQVYEMTVMNEQLKMQQNDGQTQEVAVISDKEEQKEKIEEEKKNAEEQRKNELAQKYSEDVSKIEDEISQLKNDHDLWFSLEYGKHNQPKENYYEAMVYYYEKKIKQAEKKLKDLQEKLGKLK